MYDELNEDNIQLFAAKYYDNPNCEGVEEFYEDLNRIKYLMRLFGKYDRDKELKERLIINHLVILYNVFDSRALTRILRYRLSSYEVYLKTFLFYLGQWPNETDGIIMDDNINEALKLL